jgi:hypothetical protein
LPTDPEIDPSIVLNVWNNSVSPLFHTFSRGTHCHAGKFTIAQLLAIVREPKPRSSSSTAPHVGYNGGPYDSHVLLPLSSHT